MADTSPGNHGRRSRTLIAGAAAMGAVTASIAIVAPAAHADDYPSWSDVQAAKANVAAQQAMVDRINMLIGNLQGAVTDASRTAGIAAEKYNLAVSELGAATEKAQTLQNQAKAAQKKADVSKMRAGLLASHLMRAGGQNPSVDLLLQGGHASAADKLLYQLGTMGQLTQQSQDIYDRAIADKNAAQSLTDQAKSAEDARATLAANAKSAYAGAVAAQQAAKTALATQQTQQTQLVAQLASLQNTSETVAAQYAAGVAAQRAQEEAEAAAAAQARAQQQAAANNGGSGGGGSGGGGSSSSSGGGPVSGSNTPPSQNAVAGAIAYAEAQLGKPYDLGGAGPNAFDCSGLTMMAYASVGIDIGGHNVRWQYNTMASEGRLHPYSDRQPGDLLFWYSDGSMYHVALYIGNNQIIAAPDYGEPVQIEPVWGYGGDLMNVVGRPSG